MAEQNTATQSSENQGPYRGKVRMQWVFPEHENHRRSPAWYVVVGLVSTAFFVYAIYDGNFLFALMIILIGFIFYTQYRNDPLNIPFIIYENGVQLGDTFYVYRELQDFAVVYEPPAVKRLYIRSKKMILRGELSIPLLDQDPVKVRKLLLDYLSEDLEREEESPSDTAARTLKI